MTTPQTSCLSPLLFPRNVAAWALKAGTRPLTVASAPYSSPPPGHVVIKVNDVAVRSSLPTTKLVSGRAYVADQINPIDWIIQDSDPFRSDYPTVIGYDLAGEIHAVADDVVEFQLGTRVIAVAVRAPNVRLPPGATGAFQKYAVVQAAAVAELPETIRMSVGVVLPLGISTAAAGLYQQGFLALPLPASAGKPKPLGRTALVWGGSSSVGSCAIQLAVASGVEVVATASPKNFDYCRSLGAKEVFDYHDDDAEERVVKYLENKTIVGAFHAAGANGAVQTCARIVDRSTGKAIVVSTREIPKDGIPKSVRTKYLQAVTIFGNDIGPQIWRDFLPKALKAGVVLPKPDPQIVGEELRSVQLGLDVQKKGVSARKVVVSNISQ